MSAVDRNRTIWQRIQGHCEPVFGRVVADQIATLLLGPVVAERQDASERAGSEKNLRTELDERNFATRMQLQNLHVAPVDVPGEQMQGAVAS